MLTIYAASYSMIIKQSRAISRCGLSAENTLPLGSIVVPFGGLYLGFYTVIPKRNYHEAYGYPFFALYIIPQKTPKLYPGASKNRDSQSRLKRP